MTGFPAKTLFVCQHGLDVSGHSFGVGKKVYGFDPGIVTSHKNPFRVSTLY